MQIILKLFKVCFISAGYANRLNLLLQASSQEVAILGEFLILNKNALKF